MLNRPVEDMTSNPDGGECHPLSMGYFPRIWAEMEWLWANIQGKMFQDAEAPWPSGFQEAKPPCVSGDCWDNINVVCHAWQRFAGRHSQPQFQ